MSSKSSTSDFDRNWRVELKYLLIHGIGDQDTNYRWFYEAISKLPPELACDFLPFYWEDLRQPPTKNYLHDARSCHDPLRVNAAYSAIMDLVMYQPTLKRVKFRLDSILAETLEEVIIVAHSLGSVLAYDYLKTCAAKNVKGLVTLGSPIGRRPVSTRLKNRLKSTDGLTKLHIPWVNIVGTRDYVTTWIPWFGSSIKEADFNICIVGQTHELTSYLGDKSTWSILNKLKYGAL